MIKLLDNPRMMIADEVGLGKTIIALLVYNELRSRGLSNKVLFVVPKSLVIKWKDELRGRFEIEPEIIDSEYLKRNNNAFSTEQFCYITSLDYIKQQHVRALLQQYQFDMVVLDEAHKLSAETERFAVGEILAQNSNFLPFLTATPHNGDNENFLRRMKLLDPYMPDIPSTTHLIIRNIKEDVIDLDGKEVFPPRQSRSLYVTLSRRELEIHQLVDAYVASRMAEARDRQELNAVRFLTTIIRKRASSSYFALNRTLSTRLAKLGNWVDMGKTIGEVRQADDEGEEDSYEENEAKFVGFTISKISKEKEEINEILKKIEALSSEDSKLQLLVDFVKKTKESDPQAKMVIFTEYRDTMQYIKDHLSSNYATGNIDGSMTIIERNEALEKFRDEKGFDILVCTDAAGEGIDMQFCNVEVNYDLPWNPNKLEQRMGRIHRIGQNRKVFYYNFILSDTIDGYILDKLLAKMDIIKAVLGDKIYDVIGRLIREEDIVEIYAELLNAPKEEWEAKTKRIEGVIEEKKRILDEIDKLLSSNRFDRTRLDNMKAVIKDSVDRNEVKRFVEVYLGSKGGKIEQLSKENDAYRLFLPKQLAFSSGKGVVEGSFDSNISMKRNYSYLALGNPQIMSMVTDSARPSVGVLRHPYISGFIFFYRITIRDGRGRERNGKLVALFASPDGKNTQIDPRSIWDFDLVDRTSYASVVQLDAFSNQTYEVACSGATDFLDSTTKRLSDVEKKTEESIIRYYSRQMEDLSGKIRDYLLQINESPHYSKLIQRNQTRIGNLQTELDGKLEEIRRDFKTVQSVQLVGLALVVADKEATTKKEVELAGMRAVLQYEKDRANTQAERLRIRDVSDRLTGYDIESFDRVIEVKSFSRTGFVELTSHEWLISSRVRDQYWLYVVEDALTTPKIYPVKDPFEAYKDRVKKVPIVDYRYVIEDWKIDSSLNQNAG